MSYLTPKTTENSSVSLHIRFLIPMPLITPNDFIAKWKPVVSHERQAVQEHFIDLCHLVGHPTPNEADPSGKFFAFEMGANKTSGGQGWADVAKISFFGWEYKGKDHDLDKAYDQLLHYRDSLRNPPILVVSDINKIIIRTNYTNLPIRTITLTLDDLVKPESIKILHAVFFNPDELKPQETIIGVTEEAAKQFSLLATILRNYQETPQEIAHFLIRLLFCLFAEDVGLLPEKLFPHLLTQTRRNSKDFANVLKQLFGVMKAGGSLALNASCISTVAFLTMTMSSSWTVIVWLFLLKSMRLIGARWNPQFSEPFLNAVWTPLSAASWVPTIPARAILCSL